MSSNLRFMVGDLLSTFDDPLKYISNHILAPAHAFRFLPKGDEPASVGDINYSQTYLCLEGSRIFSSEPKKMVKVLTNTGPRWCFASIFRPNK